MSRFVRQSAYRHVFGTPAKKEKVHDNIKISASAWDTNLVSVSAEYIAVNYQSSGGGAFLVTPLDKTGKLPDVFPLCRAHSAPVLDTAFSPFDDALVASAGEDGKVALTRVDAQILHDAWNGEPDVKDLEPVKKWSAHGRKTGHVLWHPTADGLLASAGLEVKLWDVENEQATVHTSDVHADMVQCLDWDWCGVQYATTCKDKKLRLFDPRAGSSATTTTESHLGVKGSRVKWLGSLDRIVTTGFSRTSERQVFLWDSRELTKGPIKTITIDQSSGTLMPFFLPANNVLFLAGKGDGNIRYYEYENDDLHYLSEYSSPSPQRGMSHLPARANNVHDNEIARFFKASGNAVEPITFVVPRKSDAFQSDIFPPAVSSKPALSAAEWLSGKTVSPVLVDLESKQEQKGSTLDYKPTPTKTTSAASPAPAAAAAAALATPATTAPSTPSKKSSIDNSTSREIKPTAASPPSEAAAATTATPPPTTTADSLSSASVKTVTQTVTNGTTTNAARDGSSSSSADKETIERLEREKAQLKEELAERDSLIRQLELKLEKVKSALS